MFFKILYNYGVDGTDFSNDVVIMELLGQTFQNEDSCIFVD